MSLSPALSTQNDIQVTVLWSGALRSSQQSDWFRHTPDTAAASSWRMGIETVLWQGAAADCGLSCRGRLTIGTKILSLYIPNRER